MRAVGPAITNDSECHRWCGTAQPLPQLAIGCPHLVRRLVLAAAACRLSPSGRHLLAEVARLATEGDSRRASALVAQALAPGSYVTRPARWPGW